MRYLAFALLLALFSGCGGGGKSAPSMEPPKQAVTEPAVVNGAGLEPPPPAPTFTDSTFESPPPMPPDFLPFLPQGKSP